MCIRVLKDFPRNGVIDFLYIYSMYIYMESSVISKGSDWWGYDINISTKCAANRHKLPV